MKKRELNVDSVVEHLIAYKEILDMQQRMIFVVTHNTQKLMNDMKKIIDDTHRYITEWEIISKASFRRLDEIKLELFEEEGDDNE
jgi:hypothetical protein